MQDSNLRMHESKSCALPTWLIPNISGERTGIRTPDTRLRRALLYPAELCTHILKSGADEGSRTPTPKALDPKSSASANSATSAYFFLGGGWWIRTTESTANRFTVCPLWPLGKSSIFGAGNRTRTYNLLITSQLLYQLSHTSILLKKYLWRPGRGSNPRPPA